MADGQRPFQIIFRFDEDPDGCSARIRGNKGAGLARMHRLGLPVPPGFTISTAVARVGLSGGGILPRRLHSRLGPAMAALEQRAGRRFGDPGDPLLVSVRSGAEASMPGMMDTVLDVGINPAIVDGIARRAGPAFAFDCYRRFLAMFGEIVLGLDGRLFAADPADPAGSAARAAGPDSAEAACARYRRLIAEATGKPVPDDPWEQLELAIRAVLRSWNNPRARLFRSLGGISDRLGTAITVQAMVFGNLGERSGTGVVFSRSRDTGEPGISGEFLPNAQGEDVVAGSTTPMPVARLRAWDPAVYEALLGHAALLERQYGHMVEVEFTVEQGRLYLLQCRTAALSPEAAAILAVHEVCRGRLTRRQAVTQLTRDQLGRLGRRRAFSAAGLEEALAARLLGRGLPAAPGVCVGRAALTADAAAALARRGEPAVLVRPDTNADDLPGMVLAQAVVTAAGGATSHAAVVARDLGIPAVVGIAACDPAARLFDTVRDGDWLSVDGTHGLVMAGQVLLVEPPPRREVRLLLHWAVRYAAPPPAPRIGVEWAERRVAVNDLLCDVYLAEAMASASRGTGLETEADRLRREVHGRCAEIFACYLAIAVVVELNQSEAYGAARYRAPTELAALDAEYGAFAGSWTAAAVAARLAGLPRERQADFFRLVAAVYRKGWWEPGYGGAVWGLIAETAERYLAGTISPTVFVDTVFHLRHHGRRLFDKHPMVRNALTDEPLLQAQLNAKKDAATPEALFLGACRPAADARLRYGPSAPVLALWRRGLELGLWRPPPDAAPPGATPAATAPALVPA